MTRRRLASGWVAVALATSACAEVLGVDFSRGHPAVADAGPDAAQTEGRDADASGDAGGARTSKLVFVTRAVALPGSDFAAGAAALCQAEGAAARPGAMFAAWFSLGTYAIDQLPNDGSWGLAVGGAVVFPSRAAVTSGVLLHPIDQSADGTPVPAAVNAWTNTKTDGSEVLQGSQRNCQSFNSRNPSLTGPAGRPAASLDGQWTDAIALPCDSSAHFICFEQ